jgi:tRNA-(ms[2]io[6]A)-hydroxylase
MVLDLRPTHPDWLDVALADLTATLCDHFHCERKAALAALSLVRSYPYEARLVAELSKLAHEETRHMMQVSAVLERRGISLTRDIGDGYAAALRTQIRRGEPERQLDCLLVSALIEARSAERLALLGRALEEPRLAGLYDRLASAELRHRDLFLDLAKPLVAPATFERRVEALLAFEGDVVATLPLESRIH